MNFNTETNVSCAVAHTLSNLSLLISFRSVENITFIFTFFRSLACLLIHLDNSNIIYIYIYIYIYILRYTNAFVVTLLFTEDSGAKEVIELLLLLNASALDMGRILSALLVKP